MGVRWEYDGSTMGVRWKYDGSTMEVRWEYDGSTMGVRWEYKGNRREYGSLAFPPLAGDFDLSLAGFAKFKDGPL